MKKLLLMICVFIFCASLLPSYASQTVVSNSRTVSMISGTNRPYIQPPVSRHRNSYRGRCHYNGDGVQVYKTPRPKYDTQYFNGYENNNFPRRSYYVPSYCQPGSSMYNGMNNPFCNQYMPYGAGMYINF